MKKKVADLEGAELDYLVAKALGLFLSVDAHQGKFILVGGDDAPQEKFSPSSEWIDGGPIVEREQITIFWNRVYTGDPCTCEAMKDCTYGMTYENAPECSTVAYGETALIAAMRCFVASKFGDEVEIE